MLYDFCLILFILINIPIFIYEALFLKKKKRDLLKRLGIKKYTFNPSGKNPIIWIHAVSLGETKASKTLLDKFREKYKNAYIIISSTTNTGYRESKENLKNANAHIYLPFDFSWTIKKLFSVLKPNIVVFVETDLWYNFIKHAKKNNSKVFLVSAKISKRSSSRFSKIPFFSKKLFSCFDLIVAQNEKYKQRFIKAHANPKIIEVGGNLKFDQKPVLLKQEEKLYWKNLLNLKNKKVITIASTHDPEEKLLLNELASIFERFSNLRVLLAPRHPERFKAVSSLIKESSIPFISLSNIDKQTGHEKIILIDKMGFLNVSYQLSDLAIVAGSFTDKIGGHNILEPALVNTPVFFGPFMFSQIDLKNLVIKNNAGKETSIKNIKTDVLNFFKNDIAQKNKNLISDNFNATGDTFEKLMKFQKD